MLSQDPKTLDEACYFGHIYNVLSEYCRSKKKGCLVERVLQSLFDFLVAHFLRSMHLPFLFSQKIVASADCGDKYPYHSYES